MSFAHELRVLELESQTELLERLRLLTRFGSNLVNITSPQGGGKTWLAQRFLEAYAQDKNQSLLMCHPNQADDQKRAILLKQVVFEPLFNEGDPIIDSFTRMVGEKPCDLVIVVDDAQLLSGDLIAELWTLVLEAHHNPNWSINVILFSTGGGLEPVLSRLSYGQEQKPIALEMEPLRPDEAENFLELQVLKYVSGEDVRKRIRKEARKTPPLPGALAALAERKAERRIIIRSIIGSPLKIALLVVALLLIITGGYLWLFSQPIPQAPEPVPMAVTVPDKAEQMVLSEDGESNLPVTEPVIDAPQAEEDSVPEGEDDTDGLPPAVTASIASVGSSDDGQRVVVPAVVVDALLEGETTDGTEIIDESLEQAREQASGSEPAEQPVEAEVQIEQIAPPVVTFSFSRNELLAVADSNYTLQLAAMLSLEEVQDFITIHEMENRVRIYPTVRSGIEWFIITYKDFPTIQQARNARAELPQSVQILEPWAKSMLQVHREIERAN